MFRSISSSPVEETISVNDSNSGNPREKEREGGGMTIKRILRRYKGRGKVERSEKTGH